MIDFHSHILPGIDDGAADVQMSLDMLYESFNQGVRIVVATPHCMLKSEEELDIFLKKRKEAYDLLVAAMIEDEREFPELRLGCELRVPEEFGAMDRLGELCIEGTNYILCEMSYRKWNMNHYDFLYALTLKGLRPIMAHIERYADKKKELPNLLSLDLLYQVNAGSFSDRQTKRYIPYLFQMGAVQLIGSDMHNLTTRKPDMKSGADAIASAYGKERLEMLLYNAKAVLDNGDVFLQRFPKMSFWEIMRL